MSPDLLHRRNITLHLQLKLLVRNPTTSSLLVAPLTNHFLLKSARCLLHSRLWTHALLHLLLTIYLLHHLQYLAVGQLLLLRQCEALRLVVKSLMMSFLSTQRACL
jgi:hypothetical protein